MDQYVNNEEERQQKLIFELYDTLNCDKVTDESLFKFMTIMTKKIPHLDLTPTKLLGINQVENDMFLELFSHDFVKI